MQKKILFGIIIIIVIIFSVSAVWGYIKNTQFYKIPSNVQAPNSETAGWKTYKNTKYGFEFKYPENAMVNDKDCCQGAMSANIEVYPENSKEIDYTKAVTMQLYDKNQVDWSDWPLVSDNSSVAKSIKLNNLLMHITVGQNGYKDIFNEITSTFRFIK